MTKRVLMTRRRWYDAVATRNPIIIQLGDDFYASGWSERRKRINIRVIIGDTRFTAKERIVRDTVMTDTVVRDTIISGRQDRS